MQTVHIPDFIIEQLFDAARVDTEVEVCGLVSKKDGITFRVYPIENIAEEKDHLFEMEPSQQIAALKSIRNNQEELFAIYHSHPHSPAKPSVTDIEQASYPDALYLIISLNSRNTPEIKGFYLREGAVETVHLETKKPPARHGGF